MRFEQARFSGEFQNLESSIVLSIDTYTKTGSKPIGKDKFGNTDSFKIIIYNMDKTQSVECTLGEGTQFVTTWKWVDLTSLGETEGLKFNIKTTKEDQWGAMTPTYFCLDGITIED